MKRITTLLLVAATLLALSACGGKSSEGEAKGDASSYTDALEVLNKVVAAYDEADLFAIYGGDQENAVMDAPGKFDVSKTEEMNVTLGLPESQAANVEDAASLMHMMNANTFTGAAYRVKAGTDMDAFAEEVKSGILATQWICGFPDTLVIINVDGTYVITAYGQKEIMETFKTNVLSALQGAEVLVEAPVA